MIVAVGFVFEVNLALYETTDRRCIMLEAVGNGGTGMSGTARASASSSASSASYGATMGVQAAPLSPRMTVDPSAGVVIMEYLTDAGDKTAQLPSEAVVAYLRSGLSADGTPIRDNSASLEAEA